MLVTVNKFSSDTPAEMEALNRLCKAEGVDCVVADNWGSGGAGAADLARAVVQTIETQPSNFKPLYADDMPLVDKLRTVATEIYRADDIELDCAAARKLAEWQETAAARFPVCMAKTQSSFSTDPALLGAPTGFNIPIRDVRLSAGAGFVVAITGEIMTMPGLPKHPAAEHIDVDDEGKIVGLS